MSVRKYSNKLSQSHILKNGISQCNRLPTNSKNSATVCEFKRKLKEHNLTNKERQNGLDLSVTNLTFIFKLKLHCIVQNKLNKLSVGFSLQIKE